LLGQSDLAIHMEVACLARGSGIRLAATDGDGVIAARDYWLPVLRDHAEITILQLKVNLAALAGIEVNALETTEGDSRRTCNGRELHIELHDLVAGELSAIADGHVGCDRLPRFDRVRQLQTAIAER